MTERYRKACSEFLHYLKGVNQLDIDRIPNELMDLIRCNADPIHKCDFDYNLPLHDLPLMDETRGLIGMICLNYLCRTNEEKTKIIRSFKEK